MNYTYLIATERLKIETHLELGMPIWPISRRIGARSSAVTSALGRHSSYSFISSTPTRPENEAATVFSASSFCKELADALAKINRRPWKCLVWEISSSHLTMKCCAQKENRGASSLVGTTLLCSRSF